MSDRARWGGARAPRGVVILGLLLACGGGDAPTPQPNAGEQAGLTGGDAAPGPVAPGANRPPVIRRVRFEPESPTTGEAIQVIVDADDPDGDRVSLSYRWTLDGRPAPGAGSRIVLKGFEKGDPIEVSVTASDGRSAARTESLRTQIANRAPEVHAVEIEPAQGIQAGTDLQVDVLAHDHDRDGLELEVTWYVDGRRRGEGETFETATVRQGAPIVAEVRVHDGSLWSEPVRSAPVQIGNTPPRIVSKPRAPGADGRFRYQLEAEDADGDRGIVFRLAEGPEGMQVDRSTGLVTWTPRDDQNGTFPVALLADDRNGGLARQEFELTVGTGPAAPAP